MFSTESFSLYSFNTKLWRLSLRQELNWKNLVRESNLFWVWRHGTLTGFSMIFSCSGLDWISVELDGTMDWKRTKFYIQYFPMLLFCWRSSWASWSAPGIRCAKYNPAPAGGVGINKKYLSSISLEPGTTHCTAYLLLRGRSDGLIVGEDHSLIWIVWIRFSRAGGGVQLLLSGDHLVGDCSLEGGGAQDGVWKGRWKVWDCIKWCFAFNTLIFLWESRSKNREKLAICWRSNSRR